MSLFDGIESTKDIPLYTDNDPFMKIIGQEEAIFVVRTAVSQHRHVLLCGVPGIGKSMLAKAAYTLLPPPKEEVKIRYNPQQPERPLAIRAEIKNHAEKQKHPSPPLYSSYIHPDELPFEVAVKMGYRCPVCGSLSLPTQSNCMQCDAPKSCDWEGYSSHRYDSFSGLFRILEITREPALMSVECSEQIGGKSYQVTYKRSNQDIIEVTKQGIHDIPDSFTQMDSDSEYTLISKFASRFIQVSGTSPVELLGDVKHDPYGSAASLSTPAHLRVVPGAIHEAHEGILYADELNTLGPYQKHLLTAMQDRKYPISGHNPHSSGAAVRVDDVPCDFILIASCNPEDLSGILKPLRSRIRGYGYEVMLHAWMEKTPTNSRNIAKFVVQTIIDDGKIPHFTIEAIKEVLAIAEDMAYRFDAQKDALTLRLRELGGLVRIAGDFAVQENAELVEPKHIRRAECIAKGIGQGNKSRDVRKTEAHYEDYFL
ncbi:MAG: ATP-binding protein [Candidatus Thorarchaeota archaeon]|jgi:predicted ATP-dependent protease